MTIQNSRRRLILQAVSAALVLPVFGQAFAQALKKLTPDNTMAKALKYTENAASSKEPSYKAGSACANCQFFTATSGACALFPTFSVSAKGWCTAWAKKA